MTQQEPEAVNLLFNLSGVADESNGEEPGFATYMYT